MRERERDGQMDGQMNGQMDRQTLLINMNHFIEQFCNKSQRERESGEEKERERVKTYIYIQKIGVTIFSEIYIQ